ncbi:origin recognition complex subunit 6 [Plakobranchus ocellatus]|uniref:Origin recognition complex subunit 6 n=1 Tax=Plakobranchus ocellatus TaxID=259542 RepID=A0AAV4ATX6_9GAST|nr:origin recognition complex subunit 6 [Plakobranchus ocellatus]
MESLKVISALLGVEDCTSLRELAVQFGCPKVVPHAADILQRYTRDQCCDIDFGSAMFLCAALFVAAKREKVKIDFTKLKERSGVKKMTFDRLIDELQKYVLHAATSEKKNSFSARKRKGLMETIDAQIQEATGILDNQ